MKNRQLLTLRWNGRFWFDSSKSSVSLLLPVIPFPNLYLDFPKQSFKINLVFDSVSRCKHFDCKILYFTAISYCQKLSGPIFIWHLINKRSHLSSTDNSTGPKNQGICTLACEFQSNNDLRALKDFRSSQQYSTTYGLMTGNSLNPKILLPFFSWPCRFSLLNRKILPHL